VKTITLHQPFASLVVAGTKTVENRTWQTSHRGQLAIHAGLRPASVSELEDLATLVELGECPEFDLKSLPRGFVLGTVDLVDIQTGFDSVWSMDTTFQWILENPVTFEEPINATGRLGLWEWPNDYD
jgi:hypothetical protein